MNDPASLQIPLFISSILCGFAGAILGLGGGMFIVPILTLCFGVSIKYAIGASLISVIATSSGASAGHLKDYYTNTRLGILLAIAASLGTWLGAVFSSSIDPGLIFLIFSMMLFVSAGIMLKPISNKTESNDALDPLAHQLGLNSSYQDGHQGPLINYSVTNVTLGLVMMTFIGMLTGLLGIGCGALRVPAMDRVMRVPIKVSAATSNFMIGISSTFSATTLLMKGLILPEIVAPVALGVLIGSWGGARLLTRIPGQLVHKAFFWILLVMAVQMGIKSYSLYRR